MAKTQKYSEDKLLEAVIKFAEIEKGKIKATELAKWCRGNMEGLEEVRDYHFTRPIKEKDIKTGKMIERPKLCTVRMDEINRSRSVMAGINTNLLLGSSDIGTFMGQPIQLQRKMIADTREAMGRLLAGNQRLARENDALMIENKRLTAELAAFIEKLGLLAKTQERLEKQVVHLMKATDEASRKEMLARMGVIDGEIDLAVYTESLRLGIDEAVRIGRTLGRYVAAESRQAKGETGDGLADAVLSGLDF